MPNRCSSLNWTQSQTWSYHRQNEQQERKKAQQASKIIRKKARKKREKEEGERERHAVKGENKIVRQLLLLLLQSMYKLSTGCIDLISDELP